MCADRVKYGLINSMGQKQLEMCYYNRRKLRWFNTSYQLYANNEQLPVSKKSKNLYAILYSKYYAQRYIISTLKGEDYFEIENDEVIKEKFKEIMSEKKLSRKKFEEKYLEVIKGLKTTGMFKHYEDLNENMKKGNLDTYQVELFYDGCLETEVFIEKKLSEDVKRFKSPKEKLVDFLKDYRFVNGWITSSGLVLATIIYSYAQKPNGN